MAPPPIFHPPEKALDAALDAFFAGLGAVRPSETALKQYREAMRAALRAFVKAWL